MEMAMSIDICKGEDESGKEESSTKEETCCGSRCQWHLDAGSQSDGSVDRDCNSCHYRLCACRAVSIKKTVDETVVGKTEKPLLQKGGADCISLHFKAFFDQFRFLSVF